MWLNPGGSTARALLAAALFALVSAMSTPSAVRADDTAEAAQLFASGNGHFQRGMSLRGARRRAELEAALNDYFASLRLVRSRNVLYNTATCLEQLERWDDAFNYWGEYLAVTGLSEAERADGGTHRDAIRPRVAVLAISTEPVGAEVWIDRRDLASRGRAPLELAVSAGAHTIYAVREGHRDADATATAVLGQSVAVALTLAARPVSVQVLAPDDATLTLDGAAISAGAALEVAPGAHVLRLELEGMAPIERRFEVLAGASPMTIDLGTATGARVTRTSTTLVIESSEPAHVSVDGVIRGSGMRLEIPVEPGAHEVRAEASGYSVFVGEHTFAAGRRTTLTLELARRGDPTLGALRIAGGVISTLGVLGAGALTIASFVARGDRTESGYQAWDATTLAADVTWPIVGALGITTLILLMIDDGGPASSGVFAIAPTEGGALAAMRLSLEAL